MEGEVRDEKTGITEKSNDRAAGAQAPSLSHMSWDM